MIAVERGDLISRGWNDYVDGHSEGWWFHRSEWLDYCLAYDDRSIDRSFALVHDGKVCAVCPAILSSGGCIETGDDPCPGPLSDDVPSLIKFVGEKLSGIPKRWRWNRGSKSSRVVDWFLRSGYSRLGWDTCIIDLRNKAVSDLWQGIRKSYRVVIRRGERDYVIKSNRNIWTMDSKLWESYEQCHRTFGSRERSNLTYSYQKDWVDAGVGYIVAGYSKEGSDKDGPSVVASPVFGSADGSSPSSLASSICSGASLSFNYKNYAYYASGPSLVRDLQHCLQWKALIGLRSLGVDFYEMGWVNHAPNQKGIEFFKRGFGGSLRRVDVVESHT
jgi:hypothetical protein